VQGMCGGGTSWKMVRLIYIVCSIKNAPYIIYYEFYLGTCTEKFDEGHSHCRAGLF